MNNASSDLAARLNAETSPLDYCHALLILVALASLATENLIHYPLGLMSIFGCVMLFRQRESARQQSMRTLTFLFACIWIPMLIAQFDAVNFERSLKTTGLYLHFFPAATYMLLVCQQRKVLSLVSAGAATLVLFVVFDAFVQLIWKVDLFGYPYDGQVLKGVFHPKQRLGLFLGVLAPLYIDLIRYWGRRYAAVWIVVLPTVIVILMSLKRSGWFMLLIGVGVYAALSWLRTRQLPGWRWFAGVVVIVGVVAATISINPGLQRHIKRSEGLLSQDFEQLDRATSYRVSLWRTGVNIVRDNPLNGIGPRGFRSVYKDYAPSEDFWIKRGTDGQTHPHLLLMEVAIETGAIGLIGMVMFTALLWIRLWRSARFGMPRWLLVAAVAWFPLNLHLAFYGSYWSSFVWILIALGLAETEVNRTEDPLNAAHPL